MLSSGDGTRGTLRYRVGESRRRETGAAGKSRTGGGSSVGKRLRAVGEGGGCGEVLSSDGGVMGNNL